MTRQLLERPEADERTVETDAGGLDEDVQVDVLREARIDAEGVAITDDDGAAYRLSIPETATGEEIAAIAATVSSALDSAGEAAASADDTDESADAWRIAGRRAATGYRSRPVADAGDAWRLAGRTRLR